MDSPKQSLEGENMSEVKDDSTFGFRHVTIAETEIVGIRLSHALPRTDKTTWPLSPLNSAQEHELVCESPC